MTEMIAAFGPLLALMLIPLWIPLIAVAASAVKGLVTPRERRSDARRRKESRTEAAAA